MSRLSRVSRPASHTISGHMIVITLRILPFSAVRNAYINVLYCLEFVLVLNHCN